MSEMTLQEKADKLREQLKKYEKDYLECVSRGHDNGARWCKNNIDGIKDFLRVYELAGLIK